jgi:mannose-6-phosphate isomerase
MDPALEEFLKTVDKSQFNHEPYVKKVEKPWGYELIFTQDQLPYTGKLMHINAGCRQSLQIHDKKQETYLLLNGQGGVLVENRDGEMDRVEFEPNKGYSTLVGQKHRLFAVTYCDILEFSTPELGNTYRLEDDYSRPTETEEMRKDPNRGWNG